MENQDDKPGSERISDFSISESIETVQLFSNSALPSEDTTAHNEVPKRNQDTEDNNTNDNVPGHFEHEASPGSPSLEFLNTEVSLAISREQTPDPYSDVTSNYTDLTPGSPESDGDYRSRRTHSSVLATDRAIKKIKLDAGGSEPVSNQAVPGPAVDDQVQNRNGKNDVLIAKASYSKRVSSKSIEKLWTNLDGPALQSLQLLFEMSMSKTIERFEGNDQKIAQCQRILTDHWMSERLPKSFLTRLNVTKLPPLRSLVLRMKGVNNDDFNPLNIDQVTQRKGSYESILSAEIKQLESLEAYLKSLEELYSLDSAYLRDFKKTAALQETQMSQEKEMYEKQLDLDPSAQPALDFRLSKPSLDIFGGNHSTFDPNTDPEVRKLLEDIKENVLDKSVPKRELLKLCDDLDVIQRQIYAKKMNDN